MLLAGILISCQSPVAGVPSTKAGRSQSVTIASGATQASLEFDDLAAGTYTVSAQALDTSGTVQFQQTSSVTISASQVSNLTLNLVPANASSLTALTSGSPTTASLAAGASVSFVVPTSLASGGCVVDTVGSSTSLEGFLQSGDGTSLGTATSPQTLGAGAGWTYAHVSYTNTSALAITQAVVTCAGKDTAGWGGDYGAWLSVPVLSVTVP